MYPKLTSESLDNYGINVVTFSAKGFVLPQSFRHRPGFDTTTVKNTDAADDDEHILTIQSAGDREFLATDPANAPARAKFRLGIFPQDHHVALAAPTPTPPATSKP